MNRYLTSCNVFEVLVLWTVCMSGITGKYLLGTAAQDSSNNSSCPERCICGVSRSIHLHEVLTTINCTNKNMKSFPEDIPTDLQVMLLKANFISSISIDIISKLRNLLELDLSGNRIKSLSRGSVFGNLTQLRYLSLGKNAIATVFHNNLRGLTSLRNLVLSDNKIIYFEDSALSDLKNLQKLDISHNLLGSLYGEWFKDLDRLTTLNIAHNRIHNLQASVFQTLLSLKYLYLSGNQISNVDPRAFSGLVSLQVLAMDDNQLDKVPTAAFQSLPNLSTLNLDGNPIIKIKPLDFSHIGVTDISLCHMPELSIIDAKAFYNLANVSSIHASNNERLIYVDSLAFMNVENLKDLQLHDNGIRGISEEIATVLPDDVEVSLYGNPFTCDCNVRWIRQFIMEGFNFKVSLTEPDHLVCHAPKNLTNKLIKDLDVRKIPRTCAPTVLNLTRSNTVSGKVGEKFLLECRALGFPVPRLHWVLPDGSFVNATLNEVRRRFFLPGTLVYYHLLPTDVGQYTCLAHNNIGDASMSINVNVSGIDIHLFALRVSATFITLTWNGTEREAFPSYKVTYSPVDKNRSLAGSTQFIVASPTVKTVIVNRLKPQTTYHFCLGYEDKSGYWLKISCCYAKTLNEESTLQGISGTSNVTVATILSSLLVILMLGVCLASVITRKYRHRLYESPDKASETSNIALDNLYKPLLSGS